MRRYPARIAVNGTVAGSRYIRGMMFNRLSRFSARSLATGVAVFAAGFTSAALAQSYPPPPGYSQPLQPAPYGAPGGYQDDRRVPDFDRLDGDDRGTALSPPGYQQQPNYQPSAPQQQSYQQPGLDPRGPVMSPDDPRYGRPMGAPAPVYSDRAPPAPVYSDRAPAPQPGYSDRGPAPIYSERGPPQGADFNDRPRPPGSIDGGPTGAVPQGNVAPNGQPMVLSALPPEEQPETGPRKELPPNLRRQEVNYPTKEPAGTIIVDTPNTHLYYILGNGRAVRYGVRVGRDGFTWTGVQKITRKAEWPDWHPPTEMIERQPYLPRFMAGGDGNPLGARAMYLGSTVYRIHGTNQPSTIGQFVSSGCIGMLNEDVTDLFERTKVGTRVVVLPGGKPPAPPVTAAATAPAGGNNGGYTPSPAAVDASYNNAPAQPRPNAAMGVPNQGPTVVPPMPAPVTIR
jgi:lipoprotein-anchoring transpeptidase ErfK/SrfK